MRRAIWILGIAAIALSVSGFTLVSPGKRARVVVGEGEPGYVFRAAQDFTNDVKKITGADLALVRGNAPRAGDVFIATTGGARSCATGKEWESYDVTAKDGVLLVAGGDARGTMFGLYDFIERYLKVDPLAFWNGVPYPKADTLAWDAVEIHQPSPTFKFRGWFINDEDFLSQWRESAGPRPVRTAKGLCSVVINHGTMEAIAEAMVRSRFNLIIPCSYIDPRVDYESENLAICARRGLFLSQHHHDPLGLGGFMFLNHWESKGKNYKYSYFSHPREVEDMWREATLYPAGDLEKHVYTNPVFGGYESFQDTFKDRLMSFVRQVDRGDTPDMIDGSGQQGLEAQKVIHAAIESLNTGKIVYIDEMFPRK